MLDGLNLLETWEFDVAGKPIPWKVPFVGRYGGARKNPALIEWQARVAGVAREVYRPREPYLGPVCLVTTFFVESGDPKLWGKIVAPKYEWIENQERHKKQGGLADESNLVKAVEDAINGILYLDDIQVRVRADVSLWAESPGCRIMVGFLDTDDPGIVVF